MENLQEKNWIVLTKDFVGEYKNTNWKKVLSRLARTYGLSPNDVYVHDDYQTPSPMKDGYGLSDLLDKYKAVLYPRRGSASLFASDEDPTDDESLSIERVMEMYDVYEADQYQDTFGSREEAEQYIESYGLQDAKIYALDLDDDMMVHEDEYDDVDMAMSQTYKIGKYADELMDLLQQEDELDAWVQSKITKASDYISAVVHYLEYEQEKSTPKF